MQILIPDASHLAASCSNLHQITGNLQSVINSHDLMIPSGHIQPPALSREHLSLETLQKAGRCHWRGAHLGHLRVWLNLSTTVCMSCCLGSNLKINAWMSSEKPTSEDCK